MPELKPEPPQTYWITRDRDIDGTLSDVFEVWLRRPWRDDNGTWMPDWSDEDWSTEDTALYGRFFAVQLAAWGVTLPDDDIQCVRKGLG